MANELGKYLRVLRKERKLRLADVGRACNRSAAFICDLEKGLRGKRPRPEMLIQLAEYFQVPVTAMLEKGGLIIDKENENYKLYMKVTRNKVKSERIRLTFGVIHELLSELEVATVAVPPLRKMVDSLMFSVRELDSVILHGR